MEKYSYLVPTLFIFRAHLEKPKVNEFSLQDKKIKKNENLTTKTKRNGISLHEKSSVTNIKKDHGKNTIKHILYHNTQPEVSLSNKNSYARVSKSTNEFPRVKIQF